ncbi:MAG: hypothetical protein HOM14_05235 [Gammaproteobacteria bacterium]|jgi:hypothetical protein|nr:hypothetical protein [Gammaproteobacteria bacterium]MBT3725763.1 hypothetical protein [Gammaproteobacteria bacterium]MBT4077520.1 hypothetical protein [Gammaproteobacteria bacterium]MBT4196067.1 hypothetical protein [Gammaproteobacteria bacterium]MBT4448814.1 hypothetical protein [Gammaproteobacteria bacterium]
MYKQFVVIILVILSVNTANAELYLEVAAEAGGNELISTNSVDSIEAGGGIKFAVGVQNPVNYDGSAAIRLSVGYLSDSIFADNGQANFSTMTFDAMLVSSSGPHSFGVGGTLHLSPEYSDNVAGYYPELIEYDDALGLVFQYSYHFVPGLEIGLRYTDITYETSGFSDDAGSLGIFLSSGF